MRLIRNFLHNINDIVLAVIIVVLAAGIIYWRMQIILDYPKQLADQQAEYQKEEAGAETVSDDAAAQTQDAQSEQPADEQTGENPEPTEGEESGEQPAATAD